MNGKERTLGLIAGTEIDSLPLVPISMQIAADEIGVPYREYATDWETQVRGQIAFVERYDIDHVSVISDPATEAADLGAEVLYPEDAPPALSEEESLLKDKAALLKLSVLDPGQGKRMSNRLRAIQGLKEQAGSDRAVEGWVEGPIAEACDLRGINRLMMDFFDDPDFVNDVMAFVFANAMRYAEAQVQAGADWIGVGDAAASLLGPDLYEEFALPFHIRYVEALHKMGTRARLHVCGDSRPLLPFLTRIGADIVDLDSISPVSLAREQSGAQQVLTGNVDPVRVLKDGSAEDVARELGSCFEASGRQAYMVAGGCEIPRGTPSANLEAMRDFARAQTVG